MPNFSSDTVTCKTTTHAHGRPIRRTKPGMPVQSGNLKRLHSDTAGDLFFRKNAVCETNGRRFYVALDGRGHPVGLKALVLASKNPNKKRSTLDEVERENTLARRAQVPHAPLRTWINETGSRAYVEQLLLSGDSKFAVDILAAELKDAGVRPSVLWWYLLEQLVAAYANLRRQRMLHLDLKPANVLYRRSHRDFVITDFGGATTQEQNAPTLMFTVSYAAPEQLSDHNASNEKTDIFLLGATLVEWITGRTLYRGTSEAQVALEMASLRNFQNGAPRDPGDVGPLRFEQMFSHFTPDPDFEALLQGMLLYDVNTRFDLGSLRSAIAQARFKGASPTIQETAQVDKAWEVVPDYSPRLSAHLDDVRRAWERELPSRFSVTALQHQNARLLNELHTLSANYHQKLARTLLNAGDAASALPHFRESVRFLPESLERNYELAYCLACTGRLDAAAEVFNRVIMANPDRVVLRTQALEMYAAVKKFNKETARSYFNLAERCVPTAPQPQVLAPTRAFFNLFTKRRRNAPA